MECKNLCIGMCRNTFSGKCDHRLLHEFDFESVFEVMMKMRRLLAYGMENCSVNREGTEQLFEAFIILTVFSMTLNTPYIISIFVT